MTNTPALNGQVIGQTERAIRALLDRVLIANELAFEAWIGIRLVATTGPVIPDVTFVSEMVDGLKIDDTAARSALGDLVADGLLTDSDGDVTLTAAGLDRFERIAKWVTDITEQLYGDLPADELETTSRILSIVRQRADAVSARS